MVYRTRSVLFLFLLLCFVIFLRISVQKNATKLTGGISSFDVAEIVRLLLSLHQALLGRLAQLPLQHRRLPVVLLAFRQS